jgi:hypothetical protein
MAKSLFPNLVAVCLSCGLLSAQEPGPAAPPVVADGGAALIIASSRSGKTLYGYSVYTGAWEGVAVDNPDNAPLKPVVGSGVAYAVVGKRVYAFSAAKGGWDAVELPEVPNPRMAVGDRIRVDSGSKIYMYSGPSGRWSFIDLAVDKEGR